MSGPPPYLTFDPALDTPGDPLEEAALVFHQRNPHVLREIVNVCLKIQATGRSRWSINAAFEVVRYNAAITTDHKVYKLNNSYRACYARWLMRDVPELGGFFVTRDSGRVRQEDGD